MILSHEYVAGLFDGEGYCSIRRFAGSIHRHKREYGFSAFAGLAIREKYMIESLIETYGGSIFKQMPYKTTHSICYKWSTTNNVTLNFLKLVSPYLLMKNKQAKKVIEFQEYRNGRKSIYAALTDDEYNKYLNLYEELTFLNKKGIGK